MTTADVKDILVLAWCAAVNGFGSSRIFLLRDKGSLIVHLHFDAINSSFIFHIHQTSRIRARDSLLP